MADCLLGMTADLSLAPLTLLAATDAEGANAVDAGGYGVVGSIIGEAARDELFRAGTRPGQTILNLEVDVGRLRRVDRPLPPHAPFSPIPSEVWQDKELNWVEIDSGRWLLRDHNARRRPGYPAPAGTCDGYPGVPLCAFVQPRGQFGVVGSSGQGALAGTVVELFVPAKVCTVPRE